MSFKSWRDYWEFDREIARERRYVRSEGSETFLKEVADTSAKRIRKLAKGKILCRAQLGNSWRHEVQIDDEVPCAFSVKRMLPLQDRAREGRVNPKGIPCLYMASDRLTAMAEVRPGVGSYISVAQLEVLRDLKLVDCSQSADRIWLHFEEPDPEKREETVWAHIDRAFSEPVSQNDDTAGYAATQTLAELFRSLGCDGVVYRSALQRDGHNVAVFDLNAAKVLNCGLYQAKTVKFDFSEADSTYYVTD